MEILCKMRVVEIAKTDIPGALMLRMCSVANDLDVLGRVTGTIRPVGLSATKCSNNPTKVFEVACVENKVKDINVGDEFAVSFSLLENARK